MLFKHTNIPKAIRIGLVVKSLKLIIKNPKWGVQFPQGASLPRDRIRQDYYEQFSSINIKIH